MGGVEEAALNGVNYVCDLPAVGSQVPGWRSGVRGCGQQGRPRGEKRD